MAITVTLTTAKGKGGEKTESNVDLAQKFHSLTQGSHAMVCEKNKLTIKLFFHVKHIWLLVRQNIY